MQIKILSTSDVHGYLFPNNFHSHDDHSPFGYLKAISAINDVRKNAKDDEIVIYIENGDFIQGSPLTDYLFRTNNEKHLNQKLNQLVNYVHPNATVLGNHEFNYGISYIQNTWKNRTFPILSANLFGHDLQKISDGPYQIIEQKGVKIAILGLTTQYVPNWEKASNLGDLQFDSAVKTAQYWVPKLHQKADIVIVSYHGGFECDLKTGEPTEKLTGENEGYALVKQVAGIDALVTGHQHREISDVVNNVPVTQPGYRGSNVGKITLDLDSNHQVIKSFSELIKTANYDVDNQGKLIISDVQQTVDQWLDKPLAHIEGDLKIHDFMDARLHGNAYLDFINRVQMDATGTDIASTSLFNDEITGFNSEVTIRDVLNSYVFPNTLVIEEISGNDLKSALEHCASFFELNSQNEVMISKQYLRPKPQLFNYDYYSGIDYTFDLTKPIGQRVVKLNYHNADIRPDQKLRLTLNQYRGIGAGDYEMFSNSKVVKSFSKDMPKLIMEYLSTHKNIKANKPDNLNIKQ
ncbi:bifunctional metallophosphatase/5'-nucleotidase [Apilactobacillus apisilvae]|uniref:Bifunctional metallophosphatase/5'-nucleotidase n=1 Tax=Apilactobacillus apisilvae TaxID=2923364 RepID=A0ABY4PHI4_9LACO|nr:bifunctional metallophosphatase/5'-nucleotidase [Apilactobacillus apisilvae]UQS84867.1 bifunctional metallophosphatase/5'-nucleotidase [Apilactobacillus apisilvae]